MEPPCDRLSVPTSDRVGFHQSEERLADGFYIDRSRRQQTDFIAAKVRIPGLPELFDPQGVNSAYLHPSQPRNPTSGALVAADGSAAIGKSSPVRRSTGAMVLCSAC